MAMMISQIGMMAKTIVRGFREQTIHVESTSYREPFPRLHTVLVGRDYYHCHDGDLKLLLEGYTPAELDLDALPTDEDGDLL